MNSDGKIGYEEAKVYTLVTEGPEMKLPMDAWGFVCKWAGAKEGPKVGLNYIQFRKTFLDEYTANLLETDLAHDYKEYVQFVTKAGKREQTTTEAEPSSTVAKAADHSSSTAVTKKAPDDAAGR